MTGMTDATAGLIVFLGVAVVFLAGCLYMAIQHPQPRDKDAG